MSEQELGLLTPNTMGWKELAEKVTKNGLKDDADLSDLYFVDAEHYWFCRSHYVVVKWFQRTYPIVLKTAGIVLKYYLEHLPFFMVWVAALLIWLSIELVIGSVDFFNIKHTSTLISYIFVDFKLSFVNFSSLLVKNYFLRAWYLLK